MNLRCMFGRHEWKHLGGKYAGDKHNIFVTSYQLFVSVYDECERCDAVRITDWRIRPNGGLTRGHIDRELA